MTWQDAVVAALKEHDRLEFEAKVTVVPSKSDPRDFHYVIELGNFTADLRESPEGSLDYSEPFVEFKPSGPPVCASTCRGFRYRDTCSHVEDEEKRKGN